MNQVQYDEKKRQELLSVIDALQAENETLIEQKRENLYCAIKMIDICHDMMKQRDAAKETNNATN